ncbi:MAG: radical SAM protein, partial [Syntrophobacteraceae bacterium]
NLPSADHAAREQELTLDEISVIAAQAVELGSVWCLITGGEPLLRPDFADIYLALKRKGLLVSLFTNATLIDEKHIALLKEYPPRDVEITVYGVTRETYERVTRKKGSFEKFMRGFNLLKASGLRVRLKAMAIRSNLHEQAAISDFCRKHTKDFFRFDPQLHLRFDADSARNSDIRGERLTPEEIVMLERSDTRRQEWMRQNCNTLINDALTHRGCNCLFHCDAGRGSFDVGYDGSFRLCSSLWAPETVYDLRKGTLENAWRSFVPRIRAMSSQRHDFLERCRACRLANLCCGVPPTPTWKSANWTLTCLISARWHTPGPMLCGPGKQPLPGDSSCFPGCEGGQKHRGERVMTLLPGTCSTPVGSSAEPPFASKGPTR